MRHTGLVKLLGIVMSGFLTAATGVASGATPPAPLLVRPDGSYPTVPLEKDVVVIKVVQNAPINLQKAASIKEGLATNVKRMAYWINEACTKGRKPDFILFNEFPLTGYSSGTRADKLNELAQHLGEQPCARSATMLEHLGRHPHRGLGRRQREARRRREQPGLRRPCDTHGKSPGGTQHWHDLRERVVIAHVRRRRLGRLGDRWRGF
jgi:hypothetical protein